MTFSKNKVHSPRRLHDWQILYTLASEVRSDFHKKFLSTELNNWMLMDRRWYSDIRFFRLHNPWPFHDSYSGCLILVQGKYVWVDGVAHWAVPAWPALQVPAFSTGNEGNEGNEVHVQTADLQGISIRTYNSTSSFQILVSGILTTGHWTSVLCQWSWQRGLWSLAIEIVTPGTLPASWASHSLQWV